jgi:hypothetical protein
MRVHKKCLFFLVLSILGIHLLQGQSTYNSPYSRFGLGDLYEPSNAMNGAMGGLKYGFRSPFLVNPANPASYTSFNKNYFVFDAGLQGSLVRMTTDDKARDDGHFGLGNMTFGIPMNAQWSGAFGLVPWSSVGYRISDPEVHPDFGGYNTIFEGNGGLHRVFIGTARKLGKNFSAGVNMNYIFGSLNYLQTVSFDSTNFLNLRSEKSRIASDVTWDAGVQYMKILNEERGLLLVAGASMAIPASVTMREDILTETFRYSGSGVVMVRDTVEFVKGEKGEVKVPMSLAGGLTLRRGDRWAFGADVAMQDWTRYEAFGQNDSLAASYQIALGGEYKVNNFFLRGGARFNQTYLQLKGNQLNEYGISFGVGIPVYNKSYSVSMLSAGVELGQRGTHQNGLIKENFGKIWLSITMNQERWFKRREYL